MADVNVVVLGGWIGSDPNIINQNQCCVFSLANSTGYGDKKNTLWVEVKSFGKTAEFVRKWLRKGDKVTVTGKISTDTWMTFNGERKCAIEVFANEISVEYCKQMQNSKNVEAD
jgi:single-strand DNA-binding protein